MPFKSKSMARACFAKNDPRWDCHQWAHERPGGIKSLPERAKGSGHVRHHLSQVRKNTNPVTRRGSR